MLKLLSDLAGQPVVSERDGAPVGRVREVVFDAAKGKVLAYRLAGPRDAYLSTVDIRAYLDHGLVIAGAEVAAPLEDLPAVKRATEAGIRPIGLRAVTGKGKRIGTVDDATVETEGHFLTKLHIKPRWWQLSAKDLIIPRARVDRFERDRVVLRYDNDGSPAGLEPEIAT
ncbi:MAG TPA: PRC-barrel domain-containing protein [Patescibacteria group bacterium]|jgi:sporulation protein YlmC with PRC-barrel domain